MKKIQIPKIIVASIFMLSMITGCGSANKTQEYKSLITLDINPSIQLHLDDDQKVMDVLAVNEDGKKVLEDMNLKQADVNVALNALLGSLVKNGYLNTNQNTVLLSVENDEEKERTALEEKLSQYIYSTLKNYSIEGAIFSQDIDIDDDIESLMKKYSISYGKANLIEEIIDEDEKQKKYTAGELAKLKIQDLILIYQSLEDDNKNHKILGNMSTAQYITQDEALDIALKNASLTKENIQNLEIDYDIENGVLTYDIEFIYNNNEYEYEVSAEQGIIEKEVEPKEAITPNITNNANTTYGNEQTSGSSGKNTNYDNTNYNDSNYGITQSSGSSGTTNQNANNNNTNYDDSNYGNNQSSSSSGAVDQNSNYGNTNYDDSNYGNNQSSNTSTTPNQNSNYDDSSNYDN